MSQILEQSPLQAGREAISRHEWHSAFDLLTEADGTTPLGPEDLESLAQAAWWTGRLEQCIAARERAYALYIEEKKTRRAAVVALEIAHDYFSKLAHSIGAGWFNRADRLLNEEGDCAEQGHLAVTHGMSCMNIRDYDGALEAAQRALDIGTRFGDRDLQAYGLLIEGAARVNKGEVKEGLALLDEATVAAVSGEIGPLASGIIYCVAISITSKLADYERAGEWTEASRRWCERQSIAGFPGVCRVHRAEIMRLRGSWAEAENEARRALAELQNFNLEFAAEGFYEIGEIRLRMGDLEEARDAFRQAHQLGRDPQPGLALLQLAEGNAENALTSMRRALQDESLDRLGRCRLLVPYTSIALAVGDLDAARAAATEAEELAQAFESSVLKASARCAKGQVELAEGNAEAAIHTLRTSWKLWRQADLPYEAARARTMLGVALRTAGDEEGALLEISAAKAAFEKLGAVLDLREAMHLLGEDVSESLPRGSVPTISANKTFMFTDIANSTGLVEAMGDEAWANMLAWHNETMRELFLSYRGEEVDNAGDGFFVAFDHPHEAVECAVRIQRAFARHRKEHGFAPQVRIGLHSAVAARTGHEYRGKGVHTAARIGALAEGGRVLASREVIEGARLRFPVSEFRKVELKGVSELVEVASISLD